MKIRSVFSFALVLVFLCSASVMAQFKEVPKDTKVKLKSGGLILGFINPKNFSIDHHVNLQYVTYGSTSMSLAAYTATLNYAVLKNLKISADVTMQYSPYASLGMNNRALDQDFQNSLSGINLSRVSLEYKPAENMYINIDYINPSMYYSDPYNNYYNRFWNYSR